MKSQPTKWDKIFASHTFDKVLISNLKHSWLLLFLPYSYHISCKLQYSHIDDTSSFLASQNFELLSFLSVVLPSTVAHYIYPDISMQCLLVWFQEIFFSHQLLSFQQINSSGILTPLTSWPHLIFIILLLFVSYSASLQALPYKYTFYFLALFLIGKTPDNSFYVFYTFLPFLDLIRIDWRGEKNMLWSQFKFMATLLEWAVISLVHSLFPSWLFSKFLVFICSPTLCRWLCLPFYHWETKAIRKELQVYHTYPSTSICTHNSAFLTLPWVNHFWYYFMLVSSFKTLDFYCLSPTQSYHFINSLFVLHQYFLYWIISINILECYYFFHLKENKPLIPPFVLGIALKFYLIC